jgi:hypothetical protein
VRGDEREADEGDELGERTDGDEGEDEENVLMHEEERVDLYE